VSIDLRDFDSLSMFSDEELANLSRYLVRRRFQPDEEIKLGAKYQRSMLLILEGSVKVYENTASGPRVLVAVKSVGQVIGKECLLNEDFELFVVTATRGTYIEVSYELLLKVVASDDVLISKLTPFIGNQEPK
jgi:signal-transduction protein with cAMP-binding, CBS, and nucleotidyltransferase domain